MNIQREIFFKKDLKDIRNSNNKLFEIEVYENKRFKFNYKYSYNYYKYEKIENENEVILKIYLKNENKLVNEFKVLKDKFYEYT